MKRYPGVVALAGVSVTLRRGEIHALLGENGAGKSTLIRLLSGITTPDSGEILLDGAPVALRKPRDAQQLGITTIHQELSLAPDLTVLENIFLGRELRSRRFGLRLLDERAMLGKVRDLAVEFGLTPDDLDCRVASLGALKQHVVEILKALAFDSRLVILDEPTSGLADHERESLFGHMRALRDRGIAVLWVTHRLDELYGLADTITVLRDGTHVATVDDVSAATPDELVRLMVGNKAETVGALATGSVARDTRWQGDRSEVLRLTGVTRLPLTDIDLTLRRGEVLGIAGIAGAGRTELARVILGADRLDSGEIAVNGLVTRIRNPRQAYRLGIALVPEDRKTTAILPDFTISKNITIADLRRVARAGVVLDRRRENAVATGFVKDLGVRTPGVHQKIRNLSGGNQQKVIVARCLFTQPSVLIFDEPTQGIDVAAKAEVYRLIHDFVDNGGAAIVISSELPELLRVSDRIAVMREGRLVGEVECGGDSTTEMDDGRAEKIMALAVRGGVA
ncbi:sugar ABC transporter ATP-binding protein [Micromonospora sp. NPDC005237]|uniref:sugar ABC transporter ATP-binding protein n=1 Tax=Micromonospora sp. NPDC005237 TaxID=3155113 RepID=UPI0033AA6116